jgi:hypothetical protein
MEQIVIACKKIREAARLLAAANERALAEERPLRRRWTARMSNSPHARNRGSPALRRGFLFFSI